MLALSLILAQEPVDYLAVAPRALAAALEPLLKHRQSQKLTVRLLVFEELKGSIGDAVRAHKPRFLLLAGDAPALPTTLVPSPVLKDDFTGMPFEPDIATDSPYGNLEGDHLPEVAVGRLPADTAAELAVMVENILAYETRAPAGPWRRRISFIAEPGNFPGAADAVIETQVGNLLAEEVPYTLDVVATYANPKSPWFYPPAKFNEHVIDRLNAGSLFFLYAGHGSIDAFSSFEWEGKSIPVLRSRDAERVDCRSGAPIVLAMACNTGEFENAAEDCIGEQLMKRPRGPVAFIGSSRISHPYGDALHAFEMLQVLAARPDALLGEIVRDAKAALVAPSKKKMRNAADLAIGLISPKTPMKESRLRAALSYNLLGDPAMRLARAPETVKLQVERVAGGWRIKGTAEGTAVTVELLCDRRAQAHPLEGVDVERTHALANDKVVKSVKAPIENGAFEVTLSADALPPAKAYYVRALAADAVGAALLP